MDASRALELAVEAERFIDAQRIGDVWRLTDQPDARVEHSLYAGTAGIVIFLLELASATGDAQYERRAVSAGLDLVTVVREKSWASVSFASGWTGYAFALDALHQRTGDPAFHAAATHCRDQLLSQATPLGKGIGWVETAPFADITKFSGQREIYDLSVGAAGSALDLIDSDSERHHTAAVQVGDRLLEVAEQSEDGLRWGLMSDMPFPFTAPNFAHGGNGVSYFMARLFDATGEQRFLDAALEGARSFVTAMQPVGDGCLVCHTEEQQPSEFYLGMCHGPAGSGRLFALLSRLTGDSQWADHLASLFRGTEALGAPETRSWGWWNNYSRCCGDSGLGDAALLFAAQQPEVLGPLVALAHRCAAVVEQVSVVQTGKRSWPQAEHRARPAFVQSQTGFRQGAAGIGSFLIHLSTDDLSTEYASAIKRANTSRILWPDERL